jgi:hypothetical protein
MAAPKQAETEKGAPRSGDAHVLAAVRPAFSLTFVVGI